MNIKHASVFLFISVMLISCSQDQNETRLQELSGPYFGQKPPVLSPEVFAPGILSTQYNDNCTPAFSADMNEVFWSVSFKYGTPNVILFMKRVNNTWTKPEVASFSGQYSDANPFFSCDGERLYFDSTRPFSIPGEPKDKDIWYVKKSGSEWSEPVNAGKNVNTEKLESHPSISKNEVLYFNSILEGYPYNLGIYKSRQVNGEFSKRVLLDEQINSKTSWEWCPFIDPDEKFIIFSSGRDGQEMDDLYCSFIKNGKWTEPIRFGPAVSSDFNERFPRVSPDGRYLFFCRSRNIIPTHFKTPQTYEQLIKRHSEPGNNTDDVMWVDAKVIENLNPDKLKQE